MAFSVWSHAAEVAEMFGVASPELRAAARIDNRVQGGVMRGGKQVLKGTDKLAGKIGSRQASAPAAAGAGGSSNRARTGAYSDYASQPTAKLIAQGNGTATLLRRNTKYGRFIRAEDLHVMRRIWQKVERDAVALSQGPLTYAQLRKKRHPYGRGPVKGRRRGTTGRIVPVAFRGTVTNKSIVNRHTGAFARAWDTTLIRDDNGIMGALENDSEHAGRLALGTPRMKAHGPFAVAVTMNEAAIDNEWRRITRIAWQRQRTYELAEAALGGGNG